MIKKFLSVGFLLPLIFPSIASANSILPDDTDFTKSGQDHYYTVVFDGEGEAAVLAKIKITNNGKEEIGKFSFEIPATSTRIIRSVQEVYEQEQYCIRYDYSPSYRCAEYKSRPSYYNPTYYSLEPQSSKLAESYQVSVNLEKGIKEGEATSLIFYYKAKGYVEKSLGVFDFAFKTAKVSSDIDNTSVSVGVQEGLYFRGGKAKTLYQEDFSTFSSGKLAVGAPSENFYGISSRIGYGSDFVKTTSGLDPYESFEVKGQYSDSWFGLYWVTIAKIIGAVIVLVLIGYLVYRLIKLKFNLKIQSPFLWLILSSLAAAILVILLVAGFVFLVEVAGVSGWAGEFGTILVLLSMLIALVLVLTLIFGPALYLGSKFGVGYGIVSILLTIFLIAILATVSIIFLKSLLGTRASLIEPLIQY